MKTYYNEWDKNAAAWLRQLIADKQITEGIVDDRSITDLRGSDLAGYDHVSLFAGIGGWDYALRLAGWPTTQPVWTVSCPCQPFSTAGKGKGANDDRNLWHEALRLVGECKPSTIFGEQVPGAIRFGWLDRVFSDLEAEGYACGAVVLPACSVNKAHKRDRIFWVANHNEFGSGGVARTICAEENRRTESRREDGSNPVGFGIGGSDGGRVAEPIGIGRGGRRDGVSGGEGGKIQVEGPVDMGGGMEYPGSSGLKERHFAGVAERSRHGGGECDADGGISNPDNQRQLGLDSLLQSEANGQLGESENFKVAGSGADIWLDFLDGKKRRIESGLEPLVNGLPRGVVPSGNIGDARNSGEARAVRLKGYGNAIVPQVAALFIKAFMDIVKH